MFKRFAAGFAAIATSLVLAAGASAATNVGQTFAPAIDDLPTKLNFMSSTATVSSNVVPADGVITSFSHFAEAVPDATLSLAVVRPAGAGFNFVGSSTPQTLTASALNSFATRISVKAGDRIGVLGDTAALGAATETSNSGDVFLATGDPLVAGQAITGLNDFIGYTIDIAANVEADVDGDGFGDESQDACPSNATIQTACVPPVVKFTYKKSQKAKSGLKLSLTSDLPATVKVTGKVKVGKKSYKLKGKSINAVANTPGTVKLSISSKIKKAIKKVGKGKATITVTSTETSGKSSKKTLKVTIKP